MAARTCPVNTNCFQFPYYNATTMTLLEPSRAGDSFQVYADLAIWDSTLNTYVDPLKVQCVATLQRGLCSGAGI
jgi:hypothetical protein